MDRPSLSIHLFEPLEVMVDGQTVIDAAYPRRKAKALFAYLFLHRGRRISKYELLADLWPAAEGADSGRVKHTVQVLRATLADARSTEGWRFICEQAGFYWFNTAAERYSDIEDFEQQLAAAREARVEGDESAGLSHLRRAAEVRRGALLAEFRYDDWAAPDVARFQELYLQVLQETASLEASQQQYQRAIEHLRIAILEDPLHESSYVDLMRYLTLDGRRTEALRVYFDLRTILKKTLDVEPQAQATCLYDAIRAGEAAAG